MLAGKLAGRTDDAMVTMFDSVGFALENFAALRFMLDAALSLGLGQKIALAPKMVDPKTLFTQLHTPTVAVGVVRILYQCQPV